MEETQTINEKCRDFVDSHIAKETEDEARKKLSESLEEEFEVRFCKNPRRVLLRSNREKRVNFYFDNIVYFFSILDSFWDFLQKLKFLAVPHIQCT